MAITAPIHSTCRQGGRGDLSGCGSEPQLAHLGEEPVASGPLLSPVGGWDLEGPPDRRALTLVLQMGRQPGGCRACPWPHSGQKQSLGWKPELQAQPNTFHPASRGRRREGLLTPHI